MPLGSGNVPPGWTEKFIQAQANPGMGASSRYGQRPPSPDSVAPRGTPEWRAAFNAQRTWMQHNIFAGATLNDLGFSPEKEHGLHAYTALREGDFSPFDTNWAQAAKGSARGTYNSTTGAFSPTSGYTQAYLDRNTGGGVKPVGAFDPVAPPLNLTGQADPAPAPNLGSFYTPTPPTDTYGAATKRRTLGSFQ